MCFRCYFYENTISVYFCMTKEKGEIFECVDNERERERTKGGPPWSCRKQ